jgi:hypothetical protein
VKSDFSLFAHREANIILLYGGARDGSIYLACSLDVIKQFLSDAAVANIVQQ